MSTHSHNYKPIYIKEIFIKFNLKLQKNKTNINIITHLFTNLVIYKITQSHKFHVFILYSRIE